MCDSGVLLLHKLQTGAKNHILVGLRHGSSTDAACTVPHVAASGNAAVAVDASINAADGLTVVVAVTYLKEMTTLLTHVVSSKQESTLMFIIHPLVTAIDILTSAFQEHAAAVMSAAMELAAAKEAEADAARERAALKKWKRLLKKLFTRMRLREQHGH